MTVYSKDILILYRFTPAHPPQTAVHDNNNKDDDNIFSFWIHFNIMPQFGQIDGYNYK